MRGVFKQTGGIGLKRTPLGSSLPLKFGANFGPDIECDRHSHVLPFAITPLLPR
jgi:hypothetical protein